ncbi:phage tail tube protein [Kitasatospora sp. NPDC001132]
MARDAEGFDTDLVRVAVTGTIYQAKAGTAIPAAGKPVGPEFTPLGTFSDDGVEHGFEEDTQEVTSWQRGTVRVIVKGRTLTLKLSALESSPAVLEAFYGAKPVIDSVSKSVTVDIKPNVARPKNAFLFEFKDGDDKTWRLHIPSGQVSQVESPKFSGGDAVMWGMTLRALGAGDNLAQWQITDPDFFADASPVDLGK